MRVGEKDTHREREREREREHNRLLSAIKWRLLL